MKTDTKNSNAFRAPSHPEQLSTDTNPRRLYEVTVHRAEHRHLTVRVEAKSEAEAEYIAEKLAKRRRHTKWELVDRELHACHVEQVKKGGRHE